MLELLKNIASALGRGEELVAATIVGGSGSSPRGSGVKMLVRPGGAILGSVGGGVLEANVIRLATELLGKPGGARLVSFELTGDEVASSGMICGGAVTVFLESLSPEEDLKQTYGRLVEALESSGGAVLLTEISGPADKAEPGPRYVLGPEEAVYGPAAGPPDELLRRARASGSAEIIEAAGGRYVVETFTAPNAAIIVGAGHVGLFTARLARMAGFRTVVIDDRDEFANRERFPEADEIRVVDSFSDCLEGTPVNENSFIVILTRGHAHDKTVLAQALTLNPGYVGMIGSRRKRDAIYEALAREGVPRDRFTAVHCPVGLDIDAETPEEIAVSIVAEMIRARAGMKRR